MSWIDIELDTSWLYTMTHSFVCVCVFACVYKVPFLTLCHDHLSDGRISKRLPK